MLIISKIHNLITVITSQNAMKTHGRAPLSFLKLCQKTPHQHFHGFSHFLSRYLQNSQIPIGLMNQLIFCMFHVKKNLSISHKIQAISGICANYLITEKVHHESV